MSNPLLYFSEILSHFYQHSLSSSHSEAWAKRDKALQVLHWHCHRLGRIENTRYMLRYCQIIRAYTESKFLDLGGSEKRGLVSSSNSVLLSLRLLIESGRFPTPQETPSPSRATIPLAALWPSPSSSSLSGGKSGRAMKQHKKSRWETGV